MTSKRGSDTEHNRPDFTQLPEPIDLSALVETHDVDPGPHPPESKFATPEIEDMTRTGAIGGGF